MRKRHYPSVPEHWQVPLGPYVQAPDEHGGEWWFVNPFTGSAPWITAMPEESWPDGFLTIYPKPTISMFMQAPNPSLATRIARSEHISELADYAGLVDFHVPDVILDHLTSWDLNFEFLLYRSHSTGRMIAFFDTPLGTWHWSLGGLLYNADHVIAQYQIDLEAADLHHEIKKIHWLNPPDPPPSKHSKFSS